MIPSIIKSDTILNKNHNEKDHESNPDATTIIFSLVAQFSRAQCHKNFTTVIYKYS